MESSKYIPTFPTTQLVAADNANYKNCFKLIYEPVDDTSGRQLLHLLTNT